jgi:transcription elongation factor Elf1
MDRDRSIGYLSCRVCGESYQVDIFVASVSSSTFLTLVWQAKINYLSEPVDVFCDWLDAAEEANEAGEAS